MIPPYYNETDIETDPRDLYFNIDDCDFQYYQDSKMKGNPVWLKVVDCFTNANDDVFDIATKKTANKDEAFDLGKRYFGNIKKLQSIRDIEIPHQTVPVEANIDEAIDIFDNINSQGTKLTDADLALTHVTGKWPQARNELKRKIRELSNRNFYFDLTFMTRALTGVVTRRALFENIHKETKENLKKGWEQLVTILDYMTTVLLNRGLGTGKFSFLPWPNTWPGFTANPLPETINQELNDEFPFSSISGNLCDSSKKGKGELSILSIF